MTEFDAQTGEVMPNGNAARAIAASHPAPPPANRSLNDAIENALKELPTWVTTDAKAAIAGDKGPKVSYASLKAILDTVRDVLLKHRVRIRQGAERSWPCDDGGGTKGRLIPVYTDFIHCVTGEVERTTVEIPLTRMDPKAMGSAITYGKRYSLLAGLGLATDEADDDGERAMPRDVAEPLREPPDVVQMKAEIDKIKEATALVAWGQDAKTRSRINKLSEAEAALVRAHYAAHGRKIVGE